MSHSENPGDSSSWILRRAKSMQNAVYPGRAPVPLSTDEPLRLRYRLVIHRGNLQAELLNQIFQEFVEK